MHFVNMQMLKFKFSLTVLFPTADSKSSLQRQIVDITTEINKVD